MDYRIKFIHITKKLFKMKIVLYSIVILFLIYSILILPDPVHMVHILLFIGGFGFFFC